MKKTKNAKPRHSPDPRLGKGHAHKSKKDYGRDGSWKKEIDAGLPHLKQVDWESLPDKTGEIK